jgi:hypothetical protein
MTYLDAARLLLAFLVTSHAPAAAEAVRDYGSLVCTHIEPSDQHQAFVLGGPSQPFVTGHKIEDAIAEIIRINAEDHQEDYYQEAFIRLGEESFLQYLPPASLSIRETELTAVLQLPGATYSYNDPFIVASLTQSKTRFAERDPVKLLELMEQDPINESLNLFEKYRRAIRITREVTMGELEKIALLIA